MNKPASTSNDPYIWFRDKRSLTIGGVCRYNVRYTRVDPFRTEFYLRIKNIENVGIRAVHLLSGPFIVYCHVIPHAYRSNVKFCPEGGQQEVAFENQVKPGQKFETALCLNENSWCGSNEKGQDMYLWEIDVISQIFVTSRTKVVYDLVLGADKLEMKRLHRKSFPSAISALGGSSKTASRENPVNYNNESFLRISHNPCLLVTYKTESDLWSSPPPRPLEPVHLVILTHGIFSNVTADMLYMKDAIESRLADNIMVRGYAGNAGLTEKGIRKLGVSLGNYLMDWIDENDSRHQFLVNKISFVGHSLGGVVQLLAIKYILLAKGNDYFERHGLEPTNLVCMATPFLGILNDMSYLISIVLDLGTLGKTGRDLTLLKQVPTFKDLFSKSKAGAEAALTRAHKSSLWKPLLEVLPDEPLHSFLAKFGTLTLYANAVNDGIVPLRTGALLYLDWEALGDVTKIDNNKKTDGERGRDHDAQAGHAGTKQARASTDSSHPPNENRLSALEELAHSNASIVGRDAEEIPTLQNSQQNKQALKKHSALRDYSKLFCLNFTLPGITKSSGSSTRRRKNRLSRKEKRIRSITAAGSDSLDGSPPLDNVDASGNSNNNNGNDDASLDREVASIVIPPKASPIESAISTLLFPVPSRNYILDPACRREVIFHDKYYRFENLPSFNDHLDANFIRKLWAFCIRHDEWKLHMQAKIAKKYQGPELTWRKVLVNLPPDAHNNIIVRRRFSNGYGWGVVDHLCKAIFDGADEGVTECA